MERDCLIVQRWPEELHLLNAGSRLNSLEVLPQPPPFRPAHTYVFQDERTAQTKLTNVEVIFRYVLPAIRTASRACLSDGRIS